MARRGVLNQAKAQKNREKYNGRITIGQVVDVNDPQQMGRVRAFCPGLGDKSEKKIEDLPWCIYVSPLGGMVDVGTRGAQESEVTGPVAYGMWNIPKLGAHVLVGIIDSDTQTRFYAGCVHPQYQTHTAPHGRYLWEKGKGTPEGPLDSHENPIEPLYSMFTKHFTGNTGPEKLDPRNNMEWRTRGIDSQTSAITRTPINNKEKTGIHTKYPDHEWGEFPSVTEEDGTQRTINGPGYGLSQQYPNDVFETTTYGYDSMVYSWTTPGFNSISMDDRQTNSRIRLRTTAGHQIIMDDTNERIYISTAGGETWIEIDQVGNIDIYASKNISTHAGGDINFFADKTFRVQAKEGIHFQTDKQFRIHSSDDVNIRSEKKILTHSVEETKMEADKNFHIKTQKSVLIFATDDIDVKSTGNTRIEQGGTLDVKTGTVGSWTTGTVLNLNAGTNMFHTSGLNMNLNAGGNMLHTAPAIHLNGPPAALASPASPASNAESANEVQAFWTSRVPQHEPWARVFMDKTADGDVGNSHVPEYDYVDKNVGRGSAVRGEKYERNKYWRR